MEDDLDIFENGRRLSKKIIKSKTVYKEYEKMWPKTCKSKTMVAALLLVT